MRVMLKWEISTILVREYTRGAPGARSSSRATSDSARTNSTMASLFSRSERTKMRFSSCSSATEAVYQTQSVNNDSLRLGMDVQDVDTHMQVLHRNGSIQHQQLRVLPYLGVDVPQDGSSRWCELWAVPLPSCALEKRLFWQRLVSIRLTLCSFGTVMHQCSHNLVNMTPKAVATPPYSH